MKNKILNITIIILMLVMCLSNIYATQNEEKYVDNDIEYIKRTYEISQEDEEKFLEELEKEFKIENKSYKLESKEKSGGDIIETIDISTIKNTVSKTKSVDSILKQLPSEIAYNQDGYVGTYKINADSIKIDTQYNGYREELVEETKIYTDLNTNDLNNIPKQIMKDNLVLDLLTTNWEITETRTIQDNELPSKYKATCYYATKIKVDNPLTYLVSVTYTGTADKTIKNNLIYEVTYKRIDVEKNYTPTLLLTSGTILIVWCLFLFRKKNITIYNLKQNEWKKIGRKRISKPVIKLDRYNNRVETNKFKIDLDDKLVKKLDGKMLKVVRNKKEISKIVDSTSSVIRVTI